MQQFDKFYFEGFDFNEKKLKASFFYSFDEKTQFIEEINFFDEKLSLREDFNLEIVKNLCFHLWIILGISYYKLCPTSEIIIKCWKIDQYQADFFKKIYINWLGEYLYRNKILPDWLCNFVSVWEKEYQKIDFPISTKALVAIGWWKDSCVSAELIREAWLDFDIITFWKNYFLHQEVAKIIWKKHIFVERKISPKLFEMNKEWYYNWHVPITWIIAFVLEIVAYLYDYKYIVLSNEKSANEWNTTWEWIEINHQYSKSLDFEKDLREYVTKYITSEVKYFSLLRGMYEVKIAQIFSKYEKYFWVFSSCNNNFKIIEENKSTAARWCNKCPKCAFVYSILRPYLSNEQTQEIFWEELYENKNLEQLFRELMWISGIKPFECVWTNEEVVYSMKLTLDKFELDWLKIPYILNIFKEEVLEKMSEFDFEVLKEKLEKIYSDDIIPEELKELLKLYN